MFSFKKICIFANCNTILICICYSLDEESFRHIFFIGNHGFMSCVV